ncbi:MAG: hypothetical protein H0X34_11330 [Chthoniobacterales bacterium]|nr:hypothetical protein [Chthoniobacterales bacterium]
MLHALVVSNGIVGLNESYVSNELVDYRIEVITADFDPDLSGLDLLIVPNGSDHVAMLKIKDQVAAFLDQGNTVCCFCGWFTNWVPGNQWIHDNRKATKDVFLSVRTDRYGLFDGLDLDKFNYNNGITGWWACGYIKASPGADVVLEDTWHRPIMVLDEMTTNGLMILTASGPVGDYRRRPGNDDGIAGLNQHILQLAAQRKETHETNRIGV